MGLNGDSDPFFSVKILDNLHAIVYPDSRPHNLETASIQKGVVLSYMGRELVEEGIGFGVPVALYQDGPRFPMAAELDFVNAPFGEAKARKVFQMDGAPQQSAGFFKGRNKVFSLFERLVMGTYTSKKEYRSFLDRTINFYDVMGIRTEFAKIEARGFVVVHYSFRFRRIGVSIDATGLEKKGLQGLLIANEQGPSFFRTYRDSSGVALNDEEIGPWEEVNCDEATISDPKDQISFTLKKVQGAKMIRGRERRRRVAWVGLQYLVNLPQNFSYEIRVA